MNEKTLDSQTHADVVELIQDEWDGAGRGSRFNIDRLAAVIERRLGYEAPKKSTEWVLGESYGGGHQLIYNESDGRCIVRKVDGREEEMRLAAGAPDLAIALGAMTREVRLESVRSPGSWRYVLAMADAALEKAGVDLES